MLRVKCRISSFTIWKQKSLLKDSVMMRQWGGGCKSRSSRGLHSLAGEGHLRGEGQVLQVYLLLMQHKEPGTNPPCTHHLGFWVHVFNINSHQENRTFEYSKISPAQPLHRHTNNVVCGKGEANWSLLPDPSKIQKSKGVTGEAPTGDIKTSAATLLFLTGYVWVWKSTELFFTSQRFVSLFASSACHWVQNRDYLLYLMTGTYMKAAWSSTYEVHYCLNLPLLLF